MVSGKDRALRGPRDIVNNGVSAQRAFSYNHPPALGPTNGKVWCRAGGTLTPAAARSRNTADGK